jgi:hypothetical protein
LEGSVPFEAGEKLEEFACFNPDCHLGGHENKLDLKGILMCGH